MTIPLLPDPASSTAARRKGAAQLSARVRPAAVTVIGFGALLTVIQLVNSILSYRLSTGHGIVPRTADGLIGVVTAPLLHASWGHLVSNLVPLLIFGFLILLGSVRQFIAVTLLVWLIAGLGVWAFGPSHQYTIGASGLVFGWLAYLVTRGVFTRSLGHIAVGLILLVLWGGVFWTGIVKVAAADLTGVVTISWQGHLFGAIGGVLAAFLVAAPAGSRKRKVAKPALSSGF